MLDMVRTDPNIRRDAARSRMLVCGLLTGGPLAHWGLVVSNTAWRGAMAFNTKLPHRPIRIRRYLCPSDA